MPDIPRNVLHEIEKYVDDLWRRGASDEERTQMLAHLAAYCVMNMCTWTESPQRGTFWNIVYAQLMRLAKGCKTTGKTPTDELSDDE